MPPAISEYEAQRLRNIEANKALLRELGLDQPFFPEPEQVVKAKPAPKKRKSTAVMDDAEEEEPDRRKSVKLESENDSVGRRRSMRNAGKPLVDYKAEQDRSARTVSESGNPRTMGSTPRKVNKRMHDPKQFGHIPGVPVGSWWETRELCSLDAVHAPWVAGISGSPDGAYSVALSGGYDDDVDLGYAFTYTGSGGRDLKGTKDKPKNLRTGPQSSDQTFENHYNKSLKISSETKKPIRVIRGYKLQSIYAPSEGYRYDGLYTVEKAWQDKGLNPKGFLVCKYAFKRLEGQPPIPERDNEGEPNPANEQAEDEDQPNEESDEGEQDAEDAAEDRVEESNVRGETSNGHHNTAEIGLEAQNIASTEPQANGEDIETDEVVIHDSDFSDQDIAQLETATGQPMVVEQKEIIGATQSANGLDARGMVKLVLDADNAISVDLPVEGPPESALSNGTDISQAAVVGLLATTAEVDPDADADAEGEVMMEGTEGEPGQSTAAATAATAAL